MAYSGSTAASSLVNVPSVTSQGITGNRTWVYNSTHVDTDVSAPNFFTDGLELGMKPGDIFVNAAGSSWPLSSTAISTGETTIHRVVVVGATTTRISTGTTLAIAAAG